MLAGNKEKLAEKENGFPSIISEKPPSIMVFGAVAGTRTRDLILTKDVLSLLSYISIFIFHVYSAPPTTSLPRQLADYSLAPPTTISAQNIAIFRAFSAPSAMF